MYSKTLNVKKYILVIKGGVHIRDFQATLLHLFGIDHERFTVNLQGLDAKLTGVEPARVVTEILA